jgi:steroid 5-alpha reductase family enzyme
MLSSMLYLDLLGWAIVSALMFVLWLIQLRTQNAGIVDIGWTFSIGILAVLYAALGSGSAVHRWTLAAMVAIWSLRLGTYLALRVIGKAKIEDSRYHALREQWPTGAGWKFLLVFEVQALTDVLLSVPFLLNAFHPDVRLTWQQFAGIAFWIVAICGESIADAQLAAFRRNPANRGRICQAGLWNYSRHPNYFFEWLVWIGWAVFASTAPWGWLAFSAPMLMFLFLFRVTGIPATEAQSLRSKGEAYAEYQRTTSAFVPWFKNRQKVA